MNPIPPSQRTPQRIAVLPGDGTGKDVTAETVKVLEAAAEAWDLPLELVHLDWDADRYLATGETLPAGLSKTSATTTPPSSSAPTATPGCRT